MRTDLNNMKPYITELITDFKKKWEFQFRGSDIQYADGILCEWLEAKAEELYQKGCSSREQKIREKIEGMKKNYDEEECCGTNGCEDCNYWGGYNKALNDILEELNK